MSAKRMRNILSPLRVALDAAVEGELIESNPLIGFKIRKRSSGKSADVDPFSADERSAILSALERQANNLVQFAFWTGLRTSELVALDWPDIDWFRGVVVVSRAMTQGMEEPEDGTKTDAGLREVKLLPPALEALKAQKAFTFLKGAEVFQNPRDRRALDWRQSHSRGHVDSCFEKSWSTLSQAVSNYGIRTRHDADGRERIRCGSPNRWGTPIGR